MAVWPLGGPFHGPDCPKWPFWGPKMLFFGPKPIYWDQPQNELLLSWSYTLTCHNISKRFAVGCYFERAPTNLVDFLEKQFKWFNDSNDSLEKWPVGIPIRCPKPEIGFAQKWARNQKLKFSSFFPQVGNGILSHWPQEIMEAFQSKIMHLNLTRKVIQYCLWWN